MNKFIVVFLLIVVYMKGSIDLFYSSDLVELELYNNSDPTE